MRNLFDQYNQPENRLSHALAVCLDEDRRFLRRFLRWADVKPPVPVADLTIVEQSLPGDPPESEEEAERKGLPDIIVHDAASWCLLIESKVQAALSADQIRRHERTLRRRGYDHIERIVLTKSGAAVRGAIARTWSGLYESVGTKGRANGWPERLRAYLRAAEVRLAREEYLTEGTLTMFDGFQFSEDNPYTYGEAKRLLKLAMAELRKDRALRRIGMDPSAAGRGAITGRRGTAVWDFLSLKDRPRRASFTRYPHLTLSIHADELIAAITIPNGVVRDVRRRLAELGTDGLADLNRRILRRAGHLLRRGGSVTAYAVQRHFRSQRSAGIVDARLDFKLETSLWKRGQAVKHQPAWIELFAALLQKKRGNVQFGYEVGLPWDTKGLQSRESLRLIVDSWMALSPLLDRVRGRQ